MHSRHKAGWGVFEKAGGFAPTMGIIGTVMGLVHVLENLDAPATLGPAISGAFIATLYGVGSANVIFLPTANKLKAMSADPAADDAAARVIDCASTCARGVRPGLVTPPVSRPTARTLRPVGGANRSGGFAGVAGAAEAGTEVEADPGRASLKPIAEPATTASSSQRVARRGTR